MRKFIMLFLLAASAAATTLTGTITIGGVPFNGTIVMYVSQAGAVDSSAHDALVPGAYTFRVSNGQMPSGAVVPGNDVILPSFTTYATNYYDPYGKLLQVSNYYVSGSTFDLGQAVPTPVTTNHVNYLDLLGLRSLSTTLLTAAIIEQVRYADQYGTCDGVTDDTAGLQAAINAAAAAKAVLAIPPGKVCLATAPLTITSGANIQGFGRRNGAASGTIKFVLTVPASSTVKLIGPPNTTTSLSNITITGLTIDYTGVTVPSGSTLIAVDAYGGNDSNIQDNLFAGPVSNPAAWSGGTVIAAKVEPSLSATPIVEANYARLSNNEFYADTQDIQFSDGGNASYPSNAGVITYNLFLDAAVTGDTGGANIRLNDSVGTLINGNRFSIPGYNVVLSGGGNTMFMGNYWDSNANTVYITNNSGQASYYYGNRNLDIANIVNSGGASTIGIDALGQTPGIDIGSGLNATPSGQPGSVHLRLADDSLAYWDHSGNAASRSWGIGNDIITFGDFGILASATQTGALADLVLYSTPTDAFLCSRISSPDSNSCLQIDNTGSVTVPKITSAVTVPSGKRLESDGIFTVVSTTVGALPLPGTAGAGAVYVVTDATSATVGACTGGGSTTMIAVSDGTAWTCH